MSPDKPARKKYPLEIRVSDPQRTVVRDIVRRGETIREAATRCAFQGIDEKPRISSDGSGYYGTLNGFPAVLFVNLS